MVIIRRLIDPFVLALLVAASVSLLAAGLLTYAPAALGDPDPPAGPTLGAGDPLFTAPPAEPAASPTPEPTEPTVGQTPPPAATFPPILPTPGPGTAPTPTATPAPTPTAEPAVASRIRIPSLRIDLPVVSGELRVRGNTGNYPLCDVAQYLTFYSQPGLPGTTYIYAHAQRGMFLPLLRASTRDDGAELIGALVEVYTNDNRLHLYRIYLVKRHSTDLTIASVPPGEQRLVLQTSEGFAGHPQKLQVAARPVSIVNVRRAAANPRPDPRICLPPG